MAPVPAEPSSRPRDHNAPGARLRDHAKITSHVATCLRGAGTRACRVPTHRDACRTCTKARPEESGCGRLRVRATIRPVTTPGGKLILWWDANDGRVVAQGDSRAVPSVGISGGRVGWRGSPQEPGSSGHHDRLSGGRIDFPA